MGVFSLPCCVRTLTFFALLLLSSRAGAQATPAPEELASSLEALGFRAPAEFKARILSLPEVGKGAQVLRAFEWHESGGDRENWWPASTLKIYPAIAALERTRALGFGPQVRLTFHYPDAPLQTTLKRLLQQALVQSNNQAFDRLVELSGWKRLHREFFTARKGLGTTVLLRSYGGRIKDAESGLGVLGDSPAISLEEEGRKELRLPVEARVPGAWLASCPRKEWRENYAFETLGNCTTLRELSESMRRIALHEELPPRERFALVEADLRVLREVLATPKPRGDGMAEALRKGYGEGRLEILHKPGFAYGWVSDVMFVSDPARRKRWVIAAAASPGRGALQSAYFYFGQLLASGRLDEAAPAAKPASRGRSR